MIKSLSSNPRPQRFGWAPGGYLNNFRGAGCKDLEDRTFFGAKRCWMCADCAYALPDPPPPVDRIQACINQIFVEYADKVEQARHRPELYGWFVGNPKLVIAACAAVGLGRVLINSHACPLRSDSDRFCATAANDARGQGRW
jgi:hypothetical protein